MSLAEDFPHLSDSELTELRLLLEDKDIEKFLVTGDFELYAQAALKIRTKADGVKPFILNDAQKLLHAEIERMQEETGWVRIIIVKGRQ